MKGRKLGRGRLTEHHRARQPQPTYDRGIGNGVTTLVDGTTVTGRKVFGINDVFETYGYAEERARLLTRLLHRLKFSDLGVEFGLPGGHKSCNRIVCLVHKGCMRR